METESPAPEITAPVARLAAVPPPGATSDATSGATDDAPVAAPKKRGRPKGSSTARTTRTVELTLTVSGTADGEWEAELKQGASWITRGLPVTAAAVLRAAQELHIQLAEPIDAVIGAAREQRAARVAALEEELEQARKALAEME
ncbi:DUF6319 family protein [Pseudonocardia sp. GCM10023141]|uniref:DUF6319 family protein n=1 Tax=Pseudonocardia sp. GCM10023141 TaxID=3252653 RepID=UPI0036173A88